MKIRIPQRFHDELPPAPPYIPAANILEEEFGSPPPSEAVEMESQPAFQTEADSYGVFREYAHGKPTVTPDHLYSYQTFPTPRTFPYIHHLVLWLEFLPFWSQQPKA